MGLNYRKSIKVGGMRLNVSKSGLGVSTGIKGLRVGVNSQGRTYVSGGTNGFYYRKNLGTTSKGNTSLRTSSFTPSSTKPVNKKDSQNGCLLMLSIIFIFLGIFWTWLFVLPLIFIITIILNFVAKKKETKLSLEYYKKLNNAIESTDYELLKSLLKNISGEKRLQKQTTEIFSSAYKHFLINAISDKVLSQNENEIINIFRESISPARFEQINTTIVDDVFVEIINDSIVSIEEESFMESLLERLTIDEEKRKEIIIKVVELKKIEQLKSNGLKPIKIDFELSKSEECFYKGEITLFKKRKEKGIFSFEPENIGELYVSNECIHIIADGHKKIKLKDIISLECDDKMIETQIFNRQTPVYFKSEESLYILAIVSKLKQ
jgi:hypothetical protein